jgi:hypothetical protein
MVWGYDKEIDIVEQLDKAIEEGNQDDKEFRRLLVEVIYELDVSLNGFQKLFPCTIKRYILGLNTPHRFIRINFFKAWKGLIEKHRGRG